MTDIYVNLAEVPREGLKLDFDLAESNTLKELAQFLSIRAVKSAHFKGEATLYEEGLKLQGTVKAEVTQDCIVTLEPILETINEPLEIRFLPNIVQEEIDPEKELDEETIRRLIEEQDPPEPLINNRINLTELIIEFIALGLNPYPRIEGAVFKDPNADEIISPFSALKGLK